jgi:hypothetical protein
MQIELPDNFASLATAAGFASVEDYVRFLVGQDATKADGAELTSDFVNEPYEAWKKRFGELIAMAQPCNPNVDDSRESIYPVR